MRKALLVCLLPVLCFAEEGMWTFDNVPVKAIKEKYGFEPSPAWLKRFQRATVKFPSGTGAFVSKNGLVITNHHIGRSSITKLSTDRVDYIQDGFTAKNLAQELKVPGLSLTVLMSSENITARVNEKVTPTMGEKEALALRQNAVSRLLKEEEAKTGLQCEEVVLYAGGEYWVYRYKKFNDVRLVAAPELQLASFGGDADNYTYPRWNLDFAVFRVYENDKPYQPEAYLPFAQDPLGLGDLTFISGYPGVTYRQQTLAQMVFARDIAIPSRLQFLARQRKALETYAKTSPEALRTSQDDIYAISNIQKRLTGQLMGLAKPENFAKVAATEKQLRTFADAHGTSKQLSSQSWQKIEGAVEKQKTLMAEACVVDSRSAISLTEVNNRDLLSSRLLGKAMLLLRVATEEAKPSDKRLAEFSEGSIKARKNDITNAAPIDKALDEARLAFGLREAREVLGASHPFVVALLGQQSPEAVAKAAVAGTKMDDLAYRKQLLEGGQKALEACQDTMVVLAKKIDPFSRAMRQRIDDDALSVMNEHGSRIAQTRFLAFGKTSYPDATSTLRISYGSVATYPTGSGTYAQPFTTYHGLYDRHLGWGGNGPKSGLGAEANAWRLPSRWVAGKDKLDLSTPFNFTYSCDTVGGNSGSPLVNAKGHFIGINFDSVLEGQGGYYVYDDATKRAVAVDARGILACLDKIMDGGHLVKELQEQ